MECNPGNRSMEAVAAALVAGDLRAALAGIEEISDQAGQARRALKAASSAAGSPRRPRAPVRGTLLGALLRCAAPPAAKSAPAGRRYRRRRLGDLGSTSSPPLTSVPVLEAAAVRDVAWNSRLYDRIVTLTPTSGGNSSRISAIRPRVPDRALRAWRLPHPSRQVGFCTLPSKRLHSPCM